MLLQVSQFGSELELWKLFDICCTIVEHSLALASRFYSYDYEARYCNRSDGGTLHYYAERHFWKKFTILEPWYHDGIAVVYYVRNSFNLVRKNHVSEFLFRSFVWFSLSLGVLSIILS